MAENHDNIMYMLGQIDSNVKGINDRLDKLNGTVGKHEDKLDALEKKQAFIRGSSTKQHGITAAVSSVVSAVAAIIISHFNK